MYRKTLQDNNRKAKDVIGGGGLVVAKPVDDDKALGLELSSARVDQVSKKYMNWATVSAIESFEDGAQATAQKVKQKIKDFVIGAGNFALNTATSSIMESKDSSPVFDLMEQNMSSLGLRLQQEGYTTDDIQRALLDVKAVWGDILSQNMSERRVEFGCRGNR